MTFVGKIDGNPEFPKENQPKLQQQEQQYDEPVFNFNNENKNPFEETAIQKRMLELGFDVNTANEVLSIFDKNNNGIVEENEYNIVMHDMQQMHIQQNEEQGITYRSIETYRAHTQEHSELIPNLKYKGNAENYLTAAQKNKLEEMGYTKLDAHYDIDTSNNYIIVTLPNGTVEVFDANGEKKDLTQEMILQKLACGPGEINLEESLREGTPLAKEIKNCQTMDDVNKVLLKYCYGDEKTAKMLMTYLQYYAKNAYGLEENYDFNQNPYHGRNISVLMGALYDAQGANFMLSRNLLSMLGEDTSDGTKLTHKITIAKTEEELQAVLLAYCKNDEELAKKMFNWMKNNIPGNENLGIGANPFLGMDNEELAAFLYGNYKSSQYLKLYGYDLALSLKSDLMKELTGETEDSKTEEGTAKDLFNQEYDEECSKPVIQYYTNFDGKLCSIEYSYDEKTESGYPLVTMTFKEGDNVRTLTYYDSGNDTYRIIDSDGNEIEEDKEAFLRRLIVEENYTAELSDTPLKTKEVEERYYLLKEREDLASKTYFGMLAQFQTEGIPDNIYNWLKTFFPGNTREQLIQEAAAYGAMSEILLDVENGNYDEANILIEEEFERRLQTCETYQDLYEELMRYYQDEDLVLEIMNSNAVLSDFNKGRLFSYMCHSCEYFSGDPKIIAKDGQVYVAYGEEEDWIDYCSFEGMELFLEDIKEASARANGFKLLDIKNDSKDSELDTENDSEDDKKLGRAYSYLTQGGEYTDTNVKNYKTAASVYSQYNIYIDKGNELQQCKTPEEAFELITGKHLYEATEEDVELFNEYYEPVKYDEESGCYKGFPYTYSGEGSYYYTVSCQLNPKTNKYELMYQQWEIADASGWEILYTPKGDPTSEDPFNKLAPYLLEQGTSFFQYMNSYLCTEQSRGLSLKLQRQEFDAFYANEENQKIVDNYIDLFIYDYIWQNKEIRDSYISKARDELDNKEYEDFSKSLKTEIINALNGEEDDIIDFMSSYGIDISEYENILAELSKLDCETDEYKSKLNDLYSLVYEKAMVKKYIQNHKFEESCNYMQYAYTKAKQDLFGKSKLDSLTSEYCTDMKTYGTKLSHFTSMAFLAASCFCPAAGTASLLMKCARWSGYIDNGLKLWNMHSNSQNALDDDYAGLALETGFEWVMKSGYRGFSNIAGDLGQSWTNWIIDNTDLGPFLATHPLAQIGFRGISEATIETSICIPYTMTIYAIQGRDYSLSQEFIENMIYDFLPYARGMQTLSSVNPEKGGIPIYGGNGEYYRWAAVNGEKLSLTDTGLPDKLTVDEGGGVRVKKEYHYSDDFNPKGKEGSYTVTEYGDDGKIKSLTRISNGGNTVETLDPNDSNKVLKTQTTEKVVNEDGTETDTYITVTKNANGEEVSSVIRDKKGRVLSSTQDGITVEYYASGIPKRVTITTRNGETKEVNYETKKGVTTASFNVEDGQVKYTIDRYGIATYELGNQKVQLPEKVLLAQIASGQTQETIAKGLMLYQNLKDVVQNDGKTCGAASLLDGINRKPMLLQTLASQFEYDSVTGKWKFQGTELDLGQGDNLIEKVYTVFLEQAGENYTGGKVTSIFDFFMPNAPKIVFTPDGENYDKLVGYSNDEYTVLTFNTQKTITDTDGNKLKQGHAYTVVGVDEDGTMKLVDPQDPTKIIKVAPNQYEQGQIAGGTYKDGDNGYTDGTPENDVAGSSPAKTISSDQLSDLKGIDDLNDALGNKTDYEHNSDFQKYLLDNNINMSDDNDVNSAYTKYVQQIQDVQKEINKSFRGSNIAVDYEFIKNMQSLGLTLNELKQVNISKDKVKTLTGEQLLELGYLEKAFKEAGFDSNTDKDFKNYLRDKIYNGTYTITDISSMNINNEEYINFKISQSQYSSDATYKKFIQDMGLDIEGIRRLNISSTDNTYRKINSDIAYFSKYKAFRGLPPDEQFKIAMQVQTLGPDVKNIVENYYKNPSGNKNLENFINLGYSVPEAALMVKIEADVYKANKTILKIMNSNSCSVEEAINIYKQKYGITNPLFLKQVFADGLIDNTTIQKYIQDRINQQNIFSCTGMNSNSVVTDVKNKLVAFAKLQQCSGNYPELKNLTFDKFVSIPESDAVVLGKNIAKPVEFEIGGKKYQLYIPISTTALVNNTSSSNTSSYTASKKDKSEMLQNGVLIDKLRANNALPDASSTSPDDTVRLAIKQALRLTNPTDELQAKTIIEHYEACRLALERGESIDYDSEKGHDFCTVIGKLYANNPTYQKKFDNVFNGLDKTSKDNLDSMAQYAYELAKQLNVTQHDAYRMLFRNECFFAENDNGDLVYIDCITLCKEISNWDVIEQGGFNFANHYFEIKKFNQTASTTTYQLRITDDIIIKYVLGNDGKIITMCLLDDMTNSLFK